MPLRQLEPFSRQKQVWTCSDLSLYSTAMQNTWRRGLVSRITHISGLASEWRQNIPTCWYLQRKILASGALPNANPQRQVFYKSVEYRWRWVPNANFLRWPCTFLFFCRFRVANANPISSGIWALDVNMLGLVQSWVIVSMR